MTVAPVLYSLWERQGISEILCTGSRSNGIDCIAQNFGHVNSIKTSVHPDVQELIAIADKAIVFWDGTEGDTEALIEIMERAGLDTIIEMVPFWDDKWFHKIRQVSGKASRKKSLKKRPKKPYTIIEYKKPEQQTTLTLERDPRPNYQITQDIKQIKLPKDFDKSIFLKDLT